MNKLFLALALALPCLLSCKQKSEHTDFGYIVQVFTGGWNNQNYDTSAIIDRLDALSDEIPIKRVIIGWNLNPEPYRQIGEFLHGKGIEMFIWLPVFSEIGGLADCSPAVDLWGNAPASYALQEGEDFTFFCPSSKGNIDIFISIYEKYFSDCGFDGVFIDKIRSQSFVAGVSGILSCGCATCTARFAELGVNLDDVKAAWETKGDDFFSVSSFDPTEGFTFSDSLLDSFLKAKADIISESVGQICDYFHAKGMLVGMDLYAPLMAQFVGQDYVRLSEKADFIKPMLYRKTEAPAGIGFEYELLKKSIPAAEGYPEITTGIDFLNEQIGYVSKASCEKYPGIEINYREDIARTDPEYIRESIGAVKAAGFSGAVLSWDVMLAPDTHIECLE